MIYMYMYVSACVESMKYMYMYLCLSHSKLRDSATVLIHTGLCTSVALVIPSSFSMGVAAGWHDLTIGSSYTLWKAD